MMYYAQVAQEVNDMYHNKCLISRHLWNSRDRRARMIYTYGMDAARTYYQYKRDHPKTGSDQHDTRNN